MPYLWRDGAVREEKGEVYGGYGVVGGGLDRDDRDAPWNSCEKELAVLRRCYSDLLLNFFEEINSLPLKTSKFSSEINSPISS